MKFIIKLNRIIAAGFVLINLLAGISFATYVNSAVNLSALDTTKTKLQQKKLKPQVLMADKLKHEEPKQEEVKTLNTQQNTLSSVNSLAEVQANLDTHSAAVQVIATPVNANKKRFSLSVQLEYLKGHTTYEIGGLFRLANGSEGIFHFPLSRLEWPINTPMSGLQLGVNFNSTTKLVLDIKSSFAGNNHGVMKDSDFGIAASEGILGRSKTDLDIYSESTISFFKAQIIEIKLPVTLFSSRIKNIVVGIGYKQQKFSYAANLIEQFSVIPSFRAKGDGGVAITYEVKNSIPYVFIGGKWLVSDAVTLVSNLSVSNSVKTTDRDNHVLRSIIGEGNLKGDAFMLDLTTNFAVYNNATISVGVSYLYLFVSGGSVNHEYGIYTHTIEEKISSEQKSVFVATTYYIQ